MPWKLVRYRSYNLVMDAGYSVEYLFEINYWTAILDELKNTLDEAVLSRLVFYLVFTSETFDVGQQPGFTNVFLIADEHQAKRSYLYNGDNIVFQSYYDEAKFGGLYDKLFAFPLGYNGHLQFEVMVPFAERKTNVFFSGNLHKGRQQLFNFFSRLRRLPFFLQHRLQKKLSTTYDGKYEQSYIRFTKGFAKGLSPKEYINMMSDSKIVLTPRGSCAEECFRHYEALKVGCIVVSEPLPKNHFFSGSPIIQIKTWAEGDAIIRALLGNPAQMQQLHADGLAWWEEVMSEKAVAQYMAKIVLQTTSG